MSETRGFVPEEYTQKPPKKESSEKLAAPEALEHDDNTPAAFIELAQIAQDIQEGAAVNFKVTPDSVEALIAVLDLLNLQNKDEWHAILTEELALLKSGQDGRIDFDKYLPQLFSVGTKGKARSLDVEIKQQGKDFAKQKAAEAHAKEVELSIEEYRLAFTPDENGDIRFTKDNIATLTGGQYADMLADRNFLQGFIAVLPESFISTKEAIQSALDREEIPTTVARSLKNTLDIDLQRYKRDSEKNESKTKLASKESTASPADLTEPKPKKEKIMVSETYATDLELLPLTEGFKNYLDSWQSGTLTDEMAQDFMDQVTTIVKDFDNYSAAKQEKIAEQFSDMANQLSAFDRSKMNPTAKAEVEFVIGQSQDFNSKLTSLAA